MRTAALILAAVAALGSGAAAATRTAEQHGATAPRLTTDAGRPLFELRNLRHGDRAERCLTLTSGDAARGYVLGRVDAGDLAAHLGLTVTRGCGTGVVLFSGSLADFAAVADGDWAEGERRRIGIAVEVVGSDGAVQGRVARATFGAGAEARGAEAPPGEPGATEHAGAAASGSAPGCSRLSFARAGRRARPVLIKRHRVDARVTAKLILRIYGAAGRQRLVLVTGLRVGRRVLPGRRWGRVAYRVGGGAAVVSRRRPFRVRIAPGALRPGRNVVRVTVVPKRGRAVQARYVLRIAAAAKGCEIG